MHLQARMGVYGRPARRAQRLAQREALKRFTGLDHFIHFSPGSEGVAPRWLHRAGGQPNGTDTASLDTDGGKGKRGAGLAGLTAAEERFTRRQKRPSEVGDGSSAVAEARSVETDFRAATDVSRNAGESKALISAAAPPFDPGYRARQNLEPTSKPLSRR
ncbi:hypothetical protein AAFF_G00432350 [Aldrovandia affinis]|uniref:Uncharacterized protein n=1 Tax=Aldrovandia affinis TaxID=143900 RepID=A0AAD7WIB9_9TELE|nr:hypothetical protein AAFF_G00432350 [Aldrovandia affinis]